MTCLQNFVFLITFCVSLIMRSSSWQVTVESHGVFQTALPPALEEHHISQEEQGGYIFSSCKYKEHFLDSLNKNILHVFILVYKNVCTFEYKMMVVLLFDNRPVTVFECLIKC